MSSLVNSRTSRFFFLLFASVMLFASGAAAQTTAATTTQAAPVAQATSSANLTNGFSGIMAGGIATPTSGGQAASGALSSVDPTTGQFSASVRIEIPAPRGNIDTSLALTYGSSEGVREAGYGWGLNLPTIERHAPFGNPGAPTYTDADEMVFSGAELVKICTVGSSSNPCPLLAGEPAIPSTYNGFVYYREAVQQSFARFFLGPNRDHWVVLLTSGEKLTFGRGTIPGTIGLANVGVDFSSQGTFRWRLIGRSDDRGNEALYIYTTLSGAAAPSYDGSNGSYAFLTDMFDTPTSSAPQTTLLFAHHVQFSYEQAGSWLINFGPVWHTPLKFQRLNAITVSSMTWNLNGQPSGRSIVRRYELSYQSAFPGGVNAQSEVVLSPDGQVSELTAITNEACNSAQSPPEGSVAASGRIGCTLFPPTTIAWTGTTSVQSRQGIVSFGGDLPSSPSYANGNVPYKPYPILIDVNNDGLTDLVMQAAPTTPGQQDIYLNVGNGGFHHVNATVSPAPRLAHSDPGQSDDVVTNSFMDVEHSQMAIGNWLNDGHPNMLMYDGNNCWVYTASGFGSDAGAWQGTMLPASECLQYQFVNENYGSSEPDGTTEYITSPAFGSPGYACQVLNGPSKCSPSLGPLAIGDLNGDGVTDSVSIDNFQAPWLSGLVSNVFPSAVDGVTGRVTPFIGSVPMQDVNGSLEASGFAASCRGGQSVNETIPTLIDMNGDGCEDLVQSDQWQCPDKSLESLVLVYPGVCDATSGGFDQALSYVITPPLGSWGTVNAPTIFGDVDGDGFADAITWSSSTWPATVVVYRGIGGGSAGQPGATTFDAPILTSPSNQPWDPKDCELSYADMDGSGFPDIVVLCHYAAHSGYITTDGVQPTHAVASISNGLGAQTSVTYSPIAPMALAASKTAHPWSSVSPQPMYAVTTLQTGNNLLVPQSENHVANYTYENAVYDNQRQRFLGFRDVTVNDSATGFTGKSVHTHYLIAKCNDDLWANVPCVNGTDDPFAALRGLPALVETFTPGTSPLTYLSTQHTEYDVETLYAGQDGRNVRFTHPVNVDTYPYSTAPWVAASISVSTPDVLSTTMPAFNNAGVGFTEQAASAIVHRQAYSYDQFGHVLASSDEDNTHGFGASLGTKQTFSWQGGFGADGWTWRMTESTAADLAAPSTLLRDTTYGYCGSGAGPACLSGELMLVEQRLDQAPKLATVATTATPNESKPGWVTTLRNVQYSSWGNVTHVEGAAGACRDIGYDPVTGQFPATVTTYSQPNCQGALTSIAIYDLHLQKPTITIDPTNQLTFVSYDYMGRTTQILVGGANCVTWPTTGEAVCNTTIDYADIGNTTPNAPAMLGQLQAVHTMTNTDDTVADVHENWTFRDGLGHRVFSLDQADRGGAPWVASGVVDYELVTGRPIATHQPVFSSMAAPAPQQTVSSAAIPTSPVLAKVAYDAFGRVTDRYAADGTHVANYQFGDNFVNVSDEGTLASTTTMATPATLTFDAHGRVVKVARTGATALNDAWSAQTQSAQLTYLATGELTSLTRSGSAMPTPSAVTRTASYDSLGRLLSNSEPNVGTWSYAYDDAGRLVGTADARGCGENFYRDALGRVIAEDYVPCGNGTYTPFEPGQAWPNGAEALYIYDQAESGQGKNVPLPASATSSAYAGRLAASYSRGAHTQLAYDQRGRTVSVAKQLALPTLDPTANGGNVWYTPTWYQQQAAYDEANRVITQTNGANVSGLANGVSLTYGKRGELSSASALTPIVAALSTTSLVSGMTYDAYGALTAEVFGDAAGTTMALAYDARERLASQVVQRNAPGFWNCQKTSLIGPQADCVRSPLGVVLGEQPTNQLTLESTSVQPGYVGNQVRQLIDNRTGSEWPAGAKPVQRFMTYDDFSRLLEVQYTYGPGGSRPLPAVTDPFVSPLLAEEGKPEVVPYSTPANLNRVTYQYFEYDSIGNITSNFDDANIFWDRSIGSVEYGRTDTAAGPNQLAASISSDGSGQLITSFDNAGNLTSIATRCNTQAVSNQTCQNHYYAYTWDEVGQLAEAQRWDMPEAASNGTWTPPPGQLPAANIYYRYDSGGQRVLRFDGDPNEGGLVNAEIFSTLRLDGAEYSYGEGDYEQSITTETAYLGAGGAIFGKMVNDAAGNLPTQAGAGVARRMHVFLDIADRLGSTSSVIDQETSELVERSTYMAYGQVESDYRPARWQSQREVYKFTGKETDLAVGLVYFGARYYAPNLGHWASPDPLAIHAMGADLNPYAYVRGNVFGDVDPVGLDGDDSVDTPSQGGGANTDSQQQTATNTVVVNQSAGALTTNPDGSTTQGCSCTLTITGPGTSGATSATSPDGGPTVNQLASLNSPLSLPDAFSQKAEQLALKATGALFLLGGRVPAPGMAQDPNSFVNRAEGSLSPAEKMVLQSVSMLVNPAADAAIAAEGFTAIERSVVSKVQGFVNGGGLAELRSTFAAGGGEVAFGGRTILVSPGMPMSGMTVGTDFAVGQAAFTSDAELTQTLLHETYRLSAGQSASGALQSAVTEFTSDAWSFAGRAYGAFF